MVLSIFIVLMFLGISGGYVAFTTEAPLTVSHSEDEEASWKTNWYPIQDVKPDTEYTLKVTVSAKPGEEEGQWGAAVLINSVDESKNSVRIAAEYLCNFLKKQEITLLLGRIQQTYL